jgi:hypothetical protein
VTAPEPPRHVEPLPAVRPLRAPALPAPESREERGIFGWARAVAFGIRDTAHDMLDEGRKGAHDAYQEGWRRYDAKTKHRRKR